MFKKRNVSHRLDVAKGLDDIQIEDGEAEAGPGLIPKSLQTKKINKFSNQIKKQTEQPSQPKKPIVVRYGLIDKDEVNSKYHANQEGEQERQPEKHSIVSLYLKKKMQELAAVQNAGDKHRDSNAEQIMQMQKQYLQMGNHKLAEYDIAQILKKLQNMATNSIKQELQNRNTYLKNLLENEYQKMEYASKKELKTIRQTKQRIQNQLRNKYTDSGRKGYMDKLKYSAMFGK